MGTLIGFLLLITGTRCVCVCVFGNGHRSKGKEAKDTHRECWWVRACGKSEGTRVYLHIIQFSVIQIKSKVLPPAVLAPFTPACFGD